MGSIIRPTSNIPLTAPAIPGMLKELKGCCFNPPVWLGRGKLYLIVVTPNPAYQTIAGFYEVPDKGIVTYIKDFKLFTGVNVERGHEQGFYIRGRRR